MAQIIFTLGTSNRTLEEFVGLLRYYGIEVVADVRTFPTSRFPHFKKETLERSLKEEGFGYSYLGKELGGYRKAGYDAYTQTGDYLRAIKLLKELVSRSRTAFFCAERLPWLCHRRLIGQSLLKRGWKVVHVIDEKRVWEDKIPKGGKMISPFLKRDETGICGHFFKKPKCHEIPLSKIYLPLVSSFRASS